MSNTEKPVRAALVGAGGIAVYKHLPALYAHRDRIEIVGVAEPNAERLGTVADEWGIPGRYSTTEELLEAEKPDLLVVCTPPVAHRDAVIAGLQAGAWVWCEKPPMLSLSEYDEVAIYEGHEGPFASYVFQHRFGSAAQRLRRHLAEKTLGRPLVSVCHTLWFRTHEYYEVPWRGKWETEGGGPTMGHGIHQMDLLLEILGDWTEVTARADVQDRDLETEDVSMAMVKFSSGALASVVNSVVSPRETSYLRFDFQDATVEVEHVYGYDNTSWRWTPAPHLASESAEPSESWLPEENVPSSHIQQLDELLDAMEKNSRPRASGDDGRRVLEFIAALYESAETGRTVRRSDLKQSGPYYTGMHDPSHTYSLSPDNAATNRKRKNV
ncbi:Gfo/Idh/MocA family protein [Nesterenkonia halotolerans]|uniref:Dehydrogenase n=1 Tax=Nesterenkonia halotolerans TaxID=225325 RepID=A0ABR9J6Z3_9MICC|nr:Gfo/Idh/MocA family oxidoreductase [Nesterenkonia halotolerans]MBE1514761.1 putative dehydrogenase [Nesterenkonia halotolerans]